MNRRRHHQMMLNEAARRRARRRRAGGVAAWGLRRVGSLLVACMLLVILAAGLGLVRLQKGPVSLGALADIVEAQLSAGADGLRYEIGETVFALGEPGEPSGLRLRDVVLRRPDGTVAASAPEMAVDLRLYDVMQGLLAPVRVQLTGARAEVLIDAEGRLRLGAPGEGEGPGAAGFVALLDEAARGHGPLRLLEEIRLTDAEVALRDEVSGRVWRLIDANAAIQRDEGGEVGRLTGVLAPPDGLPSARIPGGPEGVSRRAVLALDGSRMREGGALRLALRFADLPLADIVALAMPPEPKGGPGLAAPAETTASGAEVQTDPTAGDNVAATLPPSAPEPVGPAAAPPLTPPRSASALLTGTGSGYPATSMGGGFEAPGLPEAPASGRIELVIAPDGAPRAISASLTMGEGTVPGLAGDAARLDGAALDLEWDAEKGEARLTRFDAKGGFGEARLSGRIAQGDAPGGAQSSQAGAGAGGQVRPDATAAGGLSLALRIETLELAAALGFAEPLRFDSGSLSADIFPERRRIEVSDLQVTGPTVSATARAALEMGEAGPQVAVAFETGAFDTDALKAGWPLAAAPNARDWLVLHVGTGRVTGATGAFWMAPGVEPELSLDFAFEDVTATPLDGLPSIVGGTGSGRVSLRRFDLSMTRGSATPPGGQPIDLSGSTFAALDLREKPSFGIPRLRAEGRVADILSLLDQPPLFLTRKLGASLDGAKGRAFVEAELRFPLLAALTVDGVQVSSRSRLTDVELIAPGAGIPVTASELELVADAEQMRVSGPARVNGIPARVDWSERYGGRIERGAPKRRIRLEAQLDQAALAKLGLSALEAPAGEIDADLTLQWADINGGADFALDASLADAALSVPALGWDKARGAPGRLTARGRRGDDGSVRLDALSLEAPGLEAKGTVRLAAEGRLQRLDLTSLRMGEALDVSVGLEVDGAGARQVTVKGRRIDIGHFARREGGGQGGLELETESSAPPLRADVEVETVQLSEGVELRGASGRLRLEDGVMRARLSGAVNGGAPARMRYRRDRSGDAVVTLRSADAGRLLKDLGLSDEAAGGALKARARLPADSDGIVGVAQIDDVRVGGGEALTIIVDEASREGALPKERTAASSGYHFDRIEAPFVLLGDRLRVKNALASGPTLGLKIDGTYILGEGRLDIEGVLTPAYAVNSLFNNVPLLGELFGGEGEGLFALNFRVQGTASNPRVSFNPLSVLTPGVFRRIFDLTGDGSPAIDLPPDLFAEDGDEDE